VKASAGKVWNATVCTPLCRIRMPPRPRVRTADRRRFTG
jgi:hypothetical protein